MSKEKEEAMNEINELVNFVKESPTIMIMGLKTCMVKIEELEKKVQILEKDNFEIKTMLKYHPDFKK